MGYLRVQLVKSCAPGANIYSGDNPFHYLSQTPRRSTRQTTCCSLRQWGNLYQDQEMAMPIAGRWAPTRSPWRLRYQVAIQPEPSPLVGRPVWAIDWSHQDRNVQGYWRRCTDLEWTKRRAAGRGDSSQSTPVKLRRKWHRATYTHTINVFVPANKSVARRRNWEDRRARPTKTC